MKALSFPSSLLWFPLLLAGLITLLTLESCNKSEETPSGHHLKSCYIEYLVFRDEIAAQTTQNLQFPAGEGYSLKCEYQRENNIITRVTGGFIPVPQGTNLLRYIFSDKAYDSVCHMGDSVRVYSKFVDDFGRVTNSFVGPCTYYFDSEKKLVKIRKPGYFSTYSELNYLYLGDRIAEMYSNGDTSRIFYFSGANLVRVCHDHYLKGKIFSRTEWLFRNYDNAPNPFSGLCYLRGAFFRSFSSNNFNAYTVNEYATLSDSTFGIGGYSRIEAPFPYTDDGWPVFGAYE